VEGNAENVIAVHCKGGKGRTGSFCSAWLFYRQKKRGSAQGALNLFALRRTDPSISTQHQVGVETPSQVRYVHHICEHLRRTESFLDSPRPPPRCDRPVVQLHSLSLEDHLLAQPYHMGKVKILVMCGEEKALETPPLCPLLPIVPLDAVAVAGDVRITVFEVPTPNFNAERAMQSVANAYTVPCALFFFSYFTRVLCPCTRWKREVVWVVLGASAFMLRTWTGQGRD